MSTLVSASFRKLTRRITGFAHPSYSDRTVLCDKSTNDLVPETIFSSFPVSECSSIPNIQTMAEQEEDFSSLPFPDRFAHKVSTRSDDFYKQN